MLVEYFNKVVIVIVYLNIVFCCEKDVLSTDFDLIFYVIQLSTAVKEAEDLISLTDLLVLLQITSITYTLLHCPKKVRPPPIFTIESSQ